MHIHSDARLPVLFIFVTIILAGSFAPVHSDASDTPHYDAAQQYINAGDYDAAIGALNASIQAKEQVIDTHYLLGNLYHFIVHDTQRAKEHYEKYRILLSTLHPEDATALINAQQQEHEQAIKLFQESLTEASNHNFARAHDLLMEAVKLHPYDPMMYQNLAVICQKLGRHDDAIRYFKRVLHLDPHNEDSLFALAVAYEKKGDTPNATKLYKQVLSEYPNNTAARNNLAVLYEHVAMFDEALVLYQALIDSDPLYTRGYNNMGTIHARRGEYESAESALKQAIELEPAYLDAHFNLGMVYEAQQKYNDALHEYRFVFLNGARYPGLLEKIGRIEQLTTGKMESIDSTALLRQSPDEADNSFAVPENETQNWNDTQQCQQLRAAIKSNPDNAQVYLSLAKEYAQQHQYRMAIEVLDDTPAGDSSFNTKICLYRAALLAQQKFYYRAIQEYEAILERFGAISEAHYRLSLLYVDKDNPLRDPKKAMYHYKKWEELCGTLPDNTQDNSQ